MKYKQLLDTNMVPEWRNKYLDYCQLDGILNKAIEDKNIKTNQQGVDLYFELIKFNQKFANFFSRECQAQLDKVNSFHKDMLNELQGKFNNLQDQLDQVLSSAIYKEIQPNLTTYKRVQGTDSPQNEWSYNTISSISELFKSLRSSSSRRLNQNGAAGQDGAQRRTSTLTPPSIGVQLAADNEPPATLVNLYQSSANDANGDANGNHHRLSLTPVISGSATALRRNSNTNLRVGREKMTVIARKLSDSFSNSAQKISNNFTSFQNSFTYQNSSAHNGASNQMNGRGSLLSPRQRRLRMTDLTTKPDLDDDCKNESNKFCFLNIQALSSHQSQSRKKIVACYKKKLSNLKFAFRELYFNLVLFEQYTQLNYNGFQQILRKHDRMFASSLGRKFYEEHVQTADFYNDLQAIDHLIESVEHIYTLHFENGNRRRAIEKLQVPTCVYKPYSGKLNFRVGYEFGIFTVLSILVVLVGLLSDTGYDWRTVFRLYRSPLMLTIFLFQTGISIVIWKHYKINHVLIFELNPRNNLSFHHFIEFGSLLGIIWSISVLLFLLSSRLNVKPSICPLVVVLLILAYLLNPTRTCYHKARFWLLKRLVSV
jgi:hypothetical protein